MSDTTLKSIYKTALQGLSVARNNDATKNGLYSLLQTIYPGSNIDIKESTGTQVMSFVATIRNKTSTSNIAYLSEYLRPSITGVNSVIQYELVGYFAAMSIDVSNQNIEQIISSSPNAALCWSDFNNNTETSNTKPSKNTVSRPLQYGDDVDNKIVTFSRNDTDYKGRIDFDWGSLLTLSGFDLVIDINGEQNTYIDYLPDVQGTTQLTKSSINKCLADNGSSYQISNLIVIRSQDVFISESVSNFNNTTGTWILEYK